MIIQFILSAGLALAICYAYLQRKKSGLISLAIIAVSVGGVLAVLAPDASTVVARAVGVGRGADLVVYCWIVITLLVSVNLQFKILQLQRNLTVLTRELALRAPSRPRADAPATAGGPAEPLAGAGPFQ